jgi:hypothetical protein
MGVNAVKKMKMGLLKWLLLKSEKESKKEKVII